MSNNKHTHAKASGAIAAIVDVFLSGHMAILLAVAALLLGVAAIFLTPREEEPQIVVPMADVHVMVPGASPSEIESLITTPLERLLWQIDGVEHVYSVSQYDRAVVTVRFFVGEDREDSLLKIQSSVNANLNKINPQVASYSIQPIEIDDVPILNFALYSDELNDFDLRRVAEEVQSRLDTVSNVSQTQIIGGRSQVVRIEPNVAALEAYGLTVTDLHASLSASDSATPAGSTVKSGQVIKVDHNSFIVSVSELQQHVVTQVGGRSIFLSEVANIHDGAATINSYTRIGFGPASVATIGDRGGEYSAVTIAVSKKKGTNAVNVAKNVRARMSEIADDVLPDNVNFLVTRDSGITADGKVDELLSSLIFAMISVVGLLMFTLGWREGLIVALAVPISFSLALFTNLLLGYTINRVTLFALILTLGLVVDDPITNVDNIQRHILRCLRSGRRATLDAVGEVLPPVIMSTLTVIVSFLPLFFITGMMGPYMGPMAGTVPLTVTFSTIAALTIVPWAAYKLLRKKGADGGHTEQANDTCKITNLSKTQVLYKKLISYFLKSKARRWGLFAVVLGLMGGSMMLAVTGKVPMKLLPFDNKNELQIVVNMPEGTALENTDALVREFESYLQTVPEVTNFTSYSGLYSPIDFNGMVRHYFFRVAPHYADIRINLVDADMREQQSHSIGLRIRDDLTAIANNSGAEIALLESPPGPPVFSTVVAEITGAPDASHQDLVDAAAIVRQRMSEEPGLVDLGDTVEQSRQRLEFRLDKTKAALHGIHASQISDTLSIAMTGSHAAQLHREGERQTLPILLRLQQDDRDNLERLTSLQVRGSQGELVALGELGSFVSMPHDTPIYHKDMQRVVFIQGEMAGRSPVDAVLAMTGEQKFDNLPGKANVNWGGEGEWQITLRVFRDLGLAFGAALLGIYILLVAQTSSFVMPLLIMSAIPLTAIGIMPGFWLLNSLVDVPVGGYATPVFFTATAMIGMIALGGIVVRNSIVLIEFIQNSVSDGLKLQEAIAHSGLVRMRPIVLTALTTAIGALPITLDPIFSGLAWALIFGLVASTMFTLVVIPVTYYGLFHLKH
ncbi:MAG: efflux RND transporter permease subunit [Planctomycetes bacterium]|nr:efflux RND transporter permease subunit [Planctomycetota bacterium]